MTEAPYKKLLTYKYSVWIYDLTKQFTRRFLPSREQLRTREQMTQAARSGKQNIAEGASQGTSLKGYIKLVGIARGSLEELLEDYKDFARERKISIDLITRTNYLLDNQIKGLKEKHMKEGGFTENLYRKRIAYRKNF